MFNVGDIVRVKDLDYLRKHSNDRPYFNEYSMGHCAGQITTIRAIPYPERLVLEIDKSASYWGFDWVEHIDFDNRKVGT